MTLKELALRAKNLPDCKAFNWPGPEHYSKFNFELATASPDEMRNYLEMLANRMSAYSFALHELGNGYRQLRDLILDFEIEK